MVGKGVFEMYIEDEKEIFEGKTKMLIAVGEILHCLCLIAVMEIVHFSPIIWTFHIRNGNDFHQKCVLYEKTHSSIDLNLLLLLFY